MEEHRIADVEAQLRELGIRSGGLLLVHTAYRQVRPVEGGPLGLIAALRAALGPEGTLAMPTMTDGESLFDPNATPTFGMGITSELFWRQPGVLRSTHPGGSFAAVGPRAALLCAPQPLTPPHGIASPPGRVYQLGGQVLLLGVDHSESTVMHVAECLAGVPYFVEHPCVVEVGGVAQRVMVRETDHCCRGFRKMDGWLAARGLQREGRVGSAPAKLFEARDAVAIAVERLRLDPLIFLCPPGDGCGECTAARASLARAR
jgi:aminoglycoside 3-N-acetyltransferase